MGNIQISKKSINTTEVEEITQTHGLSQISFRGQSPRNSCDPAHRAGSSEQSNEIEMRIVSSTSNTVNSVERSHNNEERLNYLKEQENRINNWNKNISSFTTEFTRYDLLNNKIALKLTSNNLTDKTLRYYK